MRVEALRCFAVEVGKFDGNAIVFQDGKTWTKIAGDKKKTQKGVMNTSTLSTIQTCLPTESKSTRAELHCYVPRLHTLQLRACVECALGVAH